MQNRLHLLLIMLLGGTTAIAQDATLQGKVTDATTGETLLGVNVVFAPGKGAATDVNGAYILTLPPGEHRIAFSFVGYTTRTEAITLAPGERRTLDMKLSIAAAQLDMVVVSAGRFEQRVGEVTQSMSVLQPDLIRNKNLVTMSDALDQVPGVVVVDEEPQIRAGSGFSYGAGSRVQVCVDDVPILSGDIGRPNWTFLPLENIEQVEVIKGASSVLYGSAALSGVINVRTSFPRSEPRTRVVTFAGIYDTPGHKPARWWDQNQPGFGGANFFHSQKFGQFDLVLGGNAFTDNGYIGPEPVPADTIKADPYRLGPGGYEHRARFNTGLRWRSKKLTGLNFGVNGNVMKSKSTSVFIWSDTDRGIFRPKEGTTTRTLGTQFYIDPFVNYHSPAGTRHSLRTRYHRQIFDNDNGQGNSNNTYHAEYQVQQKVDFFGETVLTGGVVLRNVLSTAELYSGNDEGDGVNKAMNTAAYLQVDKKLFAEKLALSAGVRYEQFEVNGDVAGQPVFRAGTTYRVLKATYLRASYGQGFRYPTIGERFINTSVGLLRVFPNEDLDPEQSWNIEGGIKQGFKIGGFMGYLDAVVFQQEYQDYVEFTFGQWETFSWANPAANFYGFGFKSVNTGGARVSGYELELAGKGSIGKVEISTLIGWTATTPISTTPDQVYAEPVPGPPFPFPPGNTTPTIIIPAATYTNTSFDPTNNILKFRVRNTFRSDMQFQYKKVFTGFSVRYNSHVQNIDKAFVDLDDDGTLVTGVRGWMETHQSGTTLVDARLGMDLTKQLRVALIVNNLTNEVYSLRPLSIEAPRSMQVQLSANL
ncbi:MAG: TonB-dependent receptor [Flavobacteriales bacterium]|nr:TonB-dependent receptor [Flavobacteriales bacterium]